MSKFKLIPVKELRLTLCTWVIKDDDCIRKCSVCPLYETSSSLQSNNPDYHTREEVEIEIAKINKEMKG